MFGEHTNHIEGVWSALKRWPRQHAGRIPDTEASLVGYIHEFVWRQYGYGHAHVNVDRMWDMLARFSGVPIVDLPDVEDLRP